MPTCLQPQTRENLLFARVAVDLQKIDFGQLDIENKQYQTKIKERNAELLDLKVFPCVAHARAAMGPCFLALALMSVCCTRARGDGPLFFGSGASALGVPAPFYYLRRFIECITSPPLHTFICAAHCRANGPQPQPPQAHSAHKDGPLG